MSVRKKSISSRKALVIHYAFITFYFNWSNELIRYRMKRRNIHLDHMYSEKSLLFSISTLLFDMVFNRYFSSKGFIIIANILPVILFSFSCCKLYHNYQRALCDSIKFDILRHLLYFLYKGAVSSWKISYSTKYKGFFRASPV